MIRFLYIEYFSDTKEDSLTREQRIKAALKLEEVDRVPVSAWMHLSEHDQDPVSLAEATVEFIEKYDFDFVKMMPFGTYSVQDWGAKLTIYCDKYKEPIVAEPGIKVPEDYLKLDVLQANHGTWGKQLQFTHELSKRIRKDTPYVQTIFSPFSTLRKLAGPKLLEDVKNHPEKVHTALEVITETTINFVKAHLDTGVHGFFLATQNATPDVMTQEDFRAFGIDYDLQVMKAYQDETYFNIIHLHGDNVYFELVDKEYPVSCINWHDRHTAPSLAEARKISNKCFLGGIQEVPYFVGNVLHYDSILATKNAEDILAHAKEALHSIGDRGLILGPGCVADPKTPEENLHALRQAVNR